MIAPVDRIRSDFGALIAMTITAALFRFPRHHRCLANVLASECHGFGLAAFHHWFAWVSPLIVLHGLADFTTLLASNSFGDPVVAATSIMYVG